MKKKFLIVIIIVIALFGSLCLLACEDKDDSGDKCAAGHTYGAWVVDTPATCTTNGVKSRTCSVCSHKETDVILAAGHSYNDANTCTVCGYQLVFTQGLEYELNDDEASYSVTGIGTATNANIIIPAKHNDLPVTAIAGWAFFTCVDITGVEIPQSVTSIGHMAFLGCSSLTSITIPNSVTSIENMAFSNCSGLTSITVESGNIRYHSAEDCLIETATKTLIVGCKNSIIPVNDSVTSIGDYAFFGCSQLTSITIPNSVTSIGSYAFRDCSSLQYNEYDNGLYLGNSENPHVVLVKVKSTDVTSCTISNNTKFIHGDAFSYCSSLTSITIPDSVTSIGNYAFSHCRSLTSIMIPNSVTSIGSSAFLGCSSITSITIPNSVTSIGDYAFEDCSNLTSITIPNGVTSIGNHAFRSCSSLTGVYITDIAAWCNIAFGSIDANPLSYARNLYVNNVLLTELTIPNSVTSIGDSAFGGCSSLTSITIPNSVTSIGDGVFYGCSGLTSITIPNSVMSIGTYAFAYCSSLISITIPSSVTSIKWKVFIGCSNLTSINYDGTKAQWAAIVKNNPWNGATGDYTVTCTDGVLSKSEA